MKKLLKLFAITSILGILSVLLVYFYAWISPKLKINEENSYYFYDRENNLITGTNEWISINNLDKDIINATISIEDKNFFIHKGFDFLRIAKSLFNNIKNRSIKEGASTITQQYAKNLYLDFDKTIKRKLNEAWLTIRLETHYNKNEILEGYLNTINYGGVFGIENASKFYFNKSAKDLSLAEATILVGIPNRPTKYSPYNDLKAAKKRQKIVLNAMKNNKYITEEEVNKAYNEKLVFKNDEKNKNLNTIMYFQDSVLNELKKIRLNSGLLKTKGLKIYTTLDINAQKIIENKIKERITNDIQIASVIINPSNGDVLGLVGGVDYNKSQFNRATNTNRSVGSTIKPFLYYSALENNFTPSTTFKSEKTTFVFSENKKYSPTNFADKYPNKEISLGTAIAYSDNIFAVKTHLFLGTDMLVNTMKRFGVTSKLDSIPSLALGSQPISLLEMTNAYAILANEGNKIKPHFINKIEDNNGKILYEYKNNETPILNKSIVFILNEMLANTSNLNYVDYTFPTSYAIANKLTKKYAIKTGTTDTDHLIFGFNKDAVIGLWTGYDDNKKINYQETVNNKNLWADITEEYLKEHKNNWYKMPKNVVGVIVDPISGKIPNKNNKKTIIQYYIKGTEPSNNYNIEDTIPTIKYQE